MLKLPGKLSAARFLERHWQKDPLFMPAALPRIRPAITRNELAWLATLDDVESRVVFTQRDDGQVHYSAESGPFDPSYLERLPPRDWTLLVHDVEKHVPALRRLFDHVPFIPDWRIDDLMVSFAAPGGGVGPHRDHYDVFLCQGIGRREWHVTTAEVAADPTASDDLALIEAFAGNTHSAREGDVLYLPPGVAHWGTATRACLTYSIGMRAPQLSDLLSSLPDEARPDSFYRDPDLQTDEARSGYLSPQAHARSLRLVEGNAVRHADIATALGRFATRTKTWITPEGVSGDEASGFVDALVRGGRLSLHGMASIAWDEENVYVNGSFRQRSPQDAGWLQSICATRELDGALIVDAAARDCVEWMLKMGAFDLPAN